MVFFVAPLIGAAALFAGVVRAAPMPDSSIGDEVAVSAPYGVIESDTPAAYYAATSTYAPAYAPTATAAAESSSTSCTSTWSSSATVEAALATSTSTSSAYYATATYGSGSSGSSSWGGSGYDSCVQQCVASYGAPPASWTPSATSSSGSTGTGATHTVIVAPTQGVLRYIPFALNASVGDTIQFMWGANNHTVTKSSELQLCNKTSDAPFASGEQNKGFSFTQVVNDTNPTFYYCGTPGHCEKGMFGIINPPNAFEAPESVGGMMPGLVSNSSNIAAMESYASAQAGSNTMASSWGTNMNMSALPEWSYPYMAENVMYMRTFLAANPDVIDAQGNVNLGASSAPLMIPQDITQALNAVSSSAPAPAAAATPPVNAAPSPSGSSAYPSASAGSTSGAGALASSGALVALVAVAVSFLAL